MDSSSSTRSIPSETAQELDRIQAKLNESFGKCAAVIVADLQAQASKIEQLELLNTRLQLELRACSSEPHSAALSPALGSHPQRMVSDDTTALGASEYVHLSQKYNRLVVSNSGLMRENETAKSLHNDSQKENAILKAENSRLSGEVIKYADACGILKKQIRKLKDRVEEWHAFSEKMGILDSRHAPHHTSQTPEVATLDRAIAKGDVSRDSCEQVPGAESSLIIGSCGRSEEPPTVTGGSTLASDAVKTRQSSNGGSPVHQDLPRTPLLHHQSTDRTASLMGSSSHPSSDNDSNKHSTELKSDCSGDEPEFVSARPVKRRRTIQSNRGTGLRQFIKNESLDSSTQPFFIKSEPTSQCPPDHVLPGQRCAEPDTQDLDGLIEIASTPQTEVDLPQQHQSQETSSYGHTSLSSLKTKSRGPLHPLDINKKSDTPGLRELHKRHERSNVGSRAQTRISSMAEDSENYTEGFGKRPKDVLDQNFETAADASATHCRLGNLLQGQLPPSNAPQTTPSSAKRRFVETETTTHVPLITERRGRNRLVSPSTPVQSRQTQQGIPSMFSAMSKSDGTKARRLRTRPPKSLALEDFRINPTANQGLDYAFSDVVRRRAERKCLPGCMKPECCGAKFRELVRMGGFPTDPEGRGTGGKMFESSPPELSSSNPLSALDLSNQDIRILQEHLGDAANPSYLCSLSRVELEDILTDAKAKKMSDMYGKHRHQHDRGKSPPGFWRTEMPSSQEMQRDRDEAQTMVRTKVEERYREAMKSGGLWKFADE